MVTLCVPCEADVYQLIAAAMRELAPDFAVMGYMARGGDANPSIHFSVFRKGDFVLIDQRNAAGRVCPAKDGRDACIRASIISTP
jgi:hypothetical protein